MSIKIKLILFVVFSLLLAFPFFLDPSPIKENDMNGNVLQPLYLKMVLTEDHDFPFWNPYINQGTPFVHDPLNSYLYPISTIFFLTLPVNLSIKLIVFSCISLSCLSMYFLLRSLKIDTNISFLLSLTYASGGYLASRINAGHLEKVLSYPLLPLFLWTLLQVVQNPNRFWIGLSSFSLTLIFFTGDIYNVLYSLIMLLGALFYSAIFQKRITPILFVFVLFLCFSAIKFLPLIETLEHIGKDKEPFIGSQNIISIVYYLFLPFKPLFAGLQIQNFITPQFAWWEKIAFIGSLPLLTTFVFIFNFKRIKVPSKNLLVLFVLILFLISAPAFFPLSFIIQHVEFLNLFHVPSRVFAYISIIFLIFMGITINLYFKNEKYKKIIIILTTGNLLLVVVLFQSILIFKKLQNIQPELKYALTSLLEDESIYYISQRLLYSQLPQTDALLNKQKLLQTNYGFQLKDSPARNFTKHDFQNVSYTDIIPKYALLTTQEKISYGNYKHLEKFNNVQIFQTTNSTPYASVSAGTVVNQKIEINKIIIETNSKENGTLVVLESFFPGWKAYKDGIPVTLIDGRFLSVETSAGKHSYTFLFTPKSFFAGLAISLLSIIFWIISLKAHYKKYLHSVLKLF